MTVEESELQRPMGRVIRGIEFHRDALRPSAQAPAMPRNHRIGQDTPHGQQRSWPYGILKRARACEASPVPSSGSRSTKSLCTGSAASRAASLQSS